jgi:hypothetical protein
MPGRIDLRQGLDIAARVRLLCLLSPLLLFAACQDDAPGSATEQPKPDPEISYSLEVRPLLIASCVSCHADLPLHDPSRWNLVHEHEKKVETPELLQKWMNKGAKVDPHWAAQPLREVAGSSINDFLDPNGPLQVVREAPRAMFTAPVIDLIAGDLMEDKSRTISTGYLRQGEDTPEWRIEKIAQEFLGVRIGCARCHDHPTEHWTRERYGKLAELFTTPYDGIPGALPPLFVKVDEGEEAKIFELKKSLAEINDATPASAENYLKWLALDEGVPTLPGLVAAYSFDDRQLRNLAPFDGVKADGSDLIAENGVHGLGLYFDEKNELVLSELPVGTERDRFTISAWIKLEPRAPADTPIATFGTRERGFEFRVIEGKLQARWIRIWPQFAAVATSKIPLVAPGRWSHVAVTYDGTRNAGSFKIFLNGQPIEVEAAPTKLLQSVLPRGEALIISGEGLWLDELQIFREALTPLGIRQVFDGRSLMKAYETGEDLRAFYRNHFDPGEHSRQEKIRNLHDQLLELEDRFSLFMVMETADSDQNDRLKFAENLNRDLLARSLANEIWRRHFDSPLAHSLGYSDPLPSHPDLLEWLAGELQRNDFEMSHLARLIRESKAWSQAWPRLAVEPANCPRTGN